MNLIDKFNYLGYETIPSATGFKISCPFHDEDSPSCSIEESTGTFHCFGCNKSGTIKDLLSYLGIESFYEVDLLTLKRTKVLNKLADSLSEFAVFPSKARHITETIRTITPETFKKFSVYTVEDSESVFFPVQFRGKPRGYIEKVVNGEYVNHFTNGYIPYNIDRVKSSSIILVEGVFDALSVYQAGFTNVVASLSASYSKAIIRWLKIINAVNVYILYDGDDPGNKGAKNLHLAYTDSKIIKMPDNTDPNELSNLRDFLLSQGVPK